MSVRIIRKGKPVEIVSPETGRLLFAGSLALCNEARHREQSRNARRRGALVIDDRLLDDIRQYGVAKAAEMRFVDRRTVYYALARAGVDLQTLNLKYRRFHKRRA